MAVELEQLCAVVLPLARQELLPRFNRVAAAVKADGSVVTEADLACQQAVSAALAAHWPQIPLLGEEMTTAEQQRLLADSAAGLWCLDPLDGTSNFAAGIPYFALALAYIRHGEVQLGLVYDPVRDECFSAARGQGAWLNGVPLRTRATGLALARCVALVDFKRLTPALATRLACSPPFASQRNFGSSALDWCQLAAGRGQLYLHGRQNLWDYAAGSLILAEAGGCAETLQGEPVLHVGLQPRSVVATLDPALFGPWRAWIAAAGG
ncbi:inositol monophosphatase family protein [Sulfurivermis fontis]|uniref:inositol monophosphatase family protein n=1 Tax=Sulfurivermis fontis TaxID=1972068 RepID=UPI000FDB4CB4|nr:inositol monophosphatase family protein [Sulfurivermis fontis]